MATLVTTTAIATTTTQSAETLCQMKCDDTCDEIDYMIQFHNSADNLRSASDVPK